MKKSFDQQRENTGSLLFLTDSHPEAISRKNLALINIS
jgi:hypothetical protein